MYVAGDGFRVMRGARPRFAGLGGWGPTSSSSFSWSYLGGGRYSFDPPPGDAFTYDGPLYPRVIDNGDGTRTIQYNPEQSATCPIKPTSDPEAPITPGMAPKQSAGAPEGWYVLARAQGNKVQGPLSSTGIIMGPTDVVMLPADCRPNEHPSISFGESSEPEFDPYEPCSLQSPNFTGERVRIVNPLTGAELPFLYAAPSGCDSAYIDQQGKPLPKCAYPFTGNAAFWGNVQGPSGGDPTHGMVGVDPCAVSPGTGGYEKGTPGAPWAPWWDPSSEWYGHPVLADAFDSLEGTYTPPGEETPPGDFPEDEPEPGEPIPPPYYPPCRDCDTRALGPDPITGEETVLCFPEPDCTGQPPLEDPCVVGYSKVPPYGPILDRDCLGIGTEPPPGGGNGTRPGGGGYPGGNGDGNGGPGPGAGGGGGAPGAGPLGVSWVGWGAAGLALLFVLRDKDRSKGR